MSAGAEHGGRAPREADRALAVIRAAAVPVILVGDRLVAHPNVGRDPFDLVLGLCGLYAVAALGLSFSRYGGRVPRPLYPALDLVAIGALVYVSGGEFSQLRYAFFVMPVGAAFLLRPLQTAAWSVAAVLAYVAVSLPHPATPGPADVPFLATQALYLLWMGVAAVVLSGLLTRREARIAALAAARGDLVAQALGAEERERRRLADSLHDEALQSVLAARQEVVEAEQGDPLALARANALLESTARQLRETTFELHPQVLEHGGLGAALRAVAEQQARRAGFTETVLIDPSATGIADELLFSVGRELLTNVAKHAGATRVAVELVLTEGVVALEVSDDGRGSSLEERSAAPRAGHIGLASIRERVDALGGSVMIWSDRGEGTRVSVHLPVGARDGARAGEARAAAARL